MILEVYEFINHLFIYIYLWVLHGSDVDLHVGEADQQDLEQQGLSNLVGRDRGFIMAY